RIGCYCAVMPPCEVRIVSVANRLSSLARSRMPAAISSGAHALKTTERGLALERGEHINLRNPTTGVLAGCCARAANGCAAERDLRISLTCARSAHQQSG